MRMNADCPVCGLHFEREEGYFVGAMYASYGFQFAIITPVMFILLMATQSPSIVLGVLVPATLFAPVHAEALEA